MCFAQFSILYTNKDYLPAYIGSWRVITARYEVNF